MRALRAIVACATASALCIIAGLFTGVAISGVLLLRMNFFTTLDVGVGALLGATIGAALSMVTWIDYRRRDLLRVGLIAWGSSLPLALLLALAKQGALILLISPLTALLSYLDMRRLEEGVPIREFARRAVTIAAITTALGVMGATLLRCAGPSIPNSHKMAPFHSLDLPSDAALRSVATVSAEGHTLAIDLDRKNRRDQRTGRSFALSTDASDRFSPRHGRQPHASGGRAERDDRQVLPSVERHDLELERLRASPRKPPVGGSRERVADAVSSRGFS
jgi:hypothetical protein